MNYREASEYAKTIGKRGMILGLENMKHLLDVLGNPQRNLTCIHVAGTNGKGSVIAYLSEILIRAGYRTGVYTSPAVFDPLEIYQVNQIPIGKECYGQLMGQIQQAVKQLQEMGLAQPTLFEIETALAFLYFVQEDCDLVLLETGLGGQFDATNCLESVLCCVITAISYDHMAVLGDSLEAIAKQKAGIIKKGCEVVSSSQNKIVCDVLKQVCEEKQANFTIVNADEIQFNTTESLHKILIYKEFPPIELGLLGHYQLENAATAIETALVLQRCGYTIETKQIQEGLQHANWPGRLTILNQQPLVLIDGAHNEMAAKKLAEVLREDFHSTKWTFIVGVLADKEYEKIIANTAIYAEQILTITPNQTRALSGEVLAQAIRREGYDVNYVGDMKEAIGQALSWCEEDSTRGILAFGSFTFLREFKEEIEKKMLRVNRIIQNSKFLTMIDQIEQIEQNRQFCKHGWEHCMDVARAMVILNQEKKLGYSKEVLYALALVHDLGRVEEYLREVPHNEAGAELAGKLLKECGFEQSEILDITEAIRAHRNRGRNNDALSQLLVDADKKTRPCFRCQAGEQCKWPDYKKNWILEL